MLFRSAKVAQYRFVIPGARHVPRQAVRGIYWSTRLGRAAFKATIACLLVRVSEKTDMELSANGRIINGVAPVIAVLLLGSVAAHQGPTGRWWFALGACVASVAWFTGLGYGARLLSPLLRKRRAWQVLDVLIGLTMLAIGRASCRERVWTVV